MVIHQCKRHHNTWLLPLAIVIVSSFLGTHNSANGNVVPAYIWPLAYIYNQTLPITPPMEVYGNVKQASENGGLQFDGQTGWIDAGNFEGLCLYSTGCIIAFSHYWIDQRWI